MDEQSRAAVKAELAERVKRDLKLFTRIAWPLVEGARPFASGWHLDAIADHLQAVSAGQIRRLIINIPPRHMKSLSCCVFWPCWEWARRPSTQFMFASYAADLSLRDNTRARRLIESPWYQGAFQTRLAPDQNTKGRYDTTAGGYRIATSVGAKVTGEGGDIIVIDDPINALDANSEAKRREALLWFDESMRSRLNDPQSGAFVVIMQRLHEDDLTGHLLAHDTGWDHLCLPARFEPDHPTPVRSSIGWSDPRTRDGELLWPLRFGEAQVNEIAPPGTYADAGQNQQRPAPRKGGTFPREAFRLLDAAPPCSQIVRRWDLASIDGGGDWTAGVKMGLRKDGEGYVILDVQRFQKGPGAVRALIRAVAEADGPNVALRLPQDPGQAGVAQRQSFAADLAGLAPRFDIESGDKVTRAEPMAAQTEIGRVSLVRAPWNEAFLAEAAAFPRGRHDDQIDAAAGAFNALLKSHSFG